MNTRPVITPKGITRSEKSTTGHLRDNMGEGEPRINNHMALKVSWWAIFAGRPESRKLGSGSTVPRAESLLFKYHLGEGIWSRRNIRKSGSEM